MSGMLFCLWINVGLQYFEHPPTPPKIIIFILKSFSIKYPPVHCSLCFQTKRITDPASCLSTCPQPPSLPPQRVVNPVLPQPASHVVQGGRSRPLGHPPPRPQCSSPSPGATDSHPLLTSIPTLVCPWLTCVDLTTTGSRRAVVTAVIRWERESIEKKDWERESEIKERQTEKRKKRDDIEKEKESICKQRKWKR